ncbi:hypothetical protein [Vibrio cholerae]|uniref:hypothetical protein n=1 Tax=Vibrio cholerae TaxID=666 RepID=UPI000E6B7244|nr:hypothetical protein [Vibrio cholerae]AYC07046.1 hypothetical protein FORC73_3095 [Vibrio cholerae]
MPVSRITAKPVPSSVAIMGRYFQLLSGAECQVRFLGVNNDFDTEETVRVGDLLEFPTPFSRFEISSEFNVPVEIYAGVARLTRERQDFTLTGSATIRSSSELIPKAERLLVSDESNRRSITIIPLNGMIYIGSINTSINDKIPVAAGMPVTLDVTSAIYAEADPQSAFDVDVRILEEVN